MPELETAHAVARRGVVEQPLEAPVIKPPKNPLGLLISLTRAQAAVALSIPALTGVMLAWSERGQINLITLLFTVLGVLTAALGLNCLGDYIDYLYSRNLDERHSEEPFLGGYSLFMAQYVPATLGLQWGLLLLTISLLCTLWLSLLVGWPMLFFTGLSFLLALAYFVPPVRYGHHGWGIGELGVFLSYGLLQLLGSYYAQGQTLTWLPVWASLSIGLLATTVVFDYNLFHFRRDWMMRKRTLAVVVGPERGLDLSAALTLASYIAILVGVSLAQLPLWTLISLASLPIALRAFAQIRYDQVTAESCLYLYTSSIHATVATGLLFSLALWMNRLL